ncbi:DUF4345 family protein [Aquimonas voraii]|uniref:DUF4345 domain-containing protein n=1 Tax=Aquimonas voraii TaxID=265719 RepID=A0A1G7A379_9GAMM|nr:DUF4345 family protein [Aquimonas voraii]SDE09083.1 protein of unknown function [Aquimonas voraii]
MGFARIVLWLSGLGFIAFGAAFMLDPLGTLAATGIVLSGDLAAAELRAFYGGFELGVGALILASDFGARHRPYGLLLALGAYGGIAIGRAIGMLAGGVATPFLWFALAVEVVLATLALIALLRLRRLRAA